jgi:glutaredoxin
MLRTLSIPHRVIEVDSEALRGEIQQRSGSGSLPQVFIDGAPIGGYDALAESHGRRELEPLRQG